MRYRRFAGVTLPELMVVLGVVALVGMATIKLFIRATGVYTNTSAHYGPQSNEMLALKRMQFDLREAMFVSVVTPTPTTWVEVCLPKEDSSGVSYMIKGTKDMLGLVRDPARDTSYFLGKLEYPNSSDKTHWNAVPDATGHTIFKALSSTKNSDGKFPNASIIIDGVLSTPMVPDPLHPGQEIAGRLFEYWPSDPTDPTRPSVDSQLVRVTITIPVTTKTARGSITTNHTVRTQFCLRNWNSSQSTQ